MKPSTGRGNPRPMEVWSADVPFDGSHGSKDRPVIVLGRKGDTYDVLMVTTHPHDPERCMRPMDPYDAGLDSRSYIRTDKVFRLPSARFNYIMGELSDDDAALARAKRERLGGRRWTVPRLRRRSSRRRPAGSAWTCAS